MTNEESDDDSLESDDVDDLQGESFDTDLPTRHSVSNLQTRRGARCGISPCPLVPRPV